MIKALKNGWGRYMEKALMVANVPSMIGQFNMDNILILQKLGYEVHIACNMQVSSPWSVERTELFKADLKKMGIRAHTIDFLRSPFDVRRDIKSYRQIQKLIEEEDFCLIHCHTPIAAAITRVAARRARKKNTKVIYTSHGFPFCKGSPMKNWILYYPIEKWLARYTDVLITINQEDYKIAQKFKARKVYYIPGVGIDTKKFRKLSDSRSTMRKKLGLAKEDIVLLSVGELSRRKNHKVVLEALALLKTTEWFPCLHYLICGMGNLEFELKERISELGLETHVRLLGFRDDISEICNCSDIFIFPSLGEGLPMAMMEAMACGLPVICSDTRGNNDLVEDSLSGYLVKNEVSEYAAKISMLAESEELRTTLGSYARERIKALDIENIRSEMVAVYADVSDTVFKVGGYP